MTFGSSGPTSPHAPSSATDDPLTDGGTYEVPDLPAFAPFKIRLYDVTATESAINLTVRGMGFGDRVYETKTVSLTKNGSYFESDKTLVATKGQADARVLASSAIKEKDIRILTKLILHGIFGHDALPIRSHSRLQVNAINERNKGHPHID